MTLLLVNYNEIVSLDERKEGTEEGKELKKERKIKHPLLHRFVE